MTVSKKTALSFYKRSVDDKFLEECYGEESCDLEEVVENYDSTENAVSTALIIDIVGVTVKSAYEKGGPSSRRLTPVSVA